MTPHSLTNFEIEAYYKNEPGFNGVYSKDNLPHKIKDGAYDSVMWGYFCIGFINCMFMGKNLTDYTNLF